MMEGGEASARETLMRVVASESRNALARVELAASELARFETSPSQKGRVDTIREAVSEIDLLLGKIDLLSDPRRSEDTTGSDLVEVGRRVFSGIADVMSARGLSFDRQALDELIPVGLRVAVPEAALEASIFGLARVAASLVEAPSELVVRALTREGFGCLLIRIDETGDSSTPLAIERAARVELQIELAEWQGELLSSAGTWPRELGLALPLETSGG